MSNYVGDGLNTDDEALNFEREQFIRYDTYQIPNAHLLLSKIPDKNFCNEFQDLSSLALDGAAPHYCCRTCGKKYLEAYDILACCKTRAVTATESSSVINCDMVPCDVINGHIKNSVLAPMLATALNADKDFSISYNTSEQAEELLHFESHPSHPPQLPQNDSRTTNNSRRQPIKLRKPNDTQPTRMNDQAQRNSNKTNPSYNNKKVKKQQDDTMATPDPKQKSITQFTCARKTEPDMVRLQPRNNESKSVKIQVKMDQFTIPKPQYPKRAPFNSVNEERHEEKNNKMTGENMGENVKRRCDELPMLMLDPHIVFTLFGGSNSTLSPIQ